MTRTRLEARSIEASQWRANVHQFFVAIIAAAMLAAASPARADDAGKVDELSKILLDHSSYKVRVQAALVLGKLGNRNAVPALTKALNDSHNTVRAMAAQALGRLGAPEAATALRDRLEREKDSFARGQMERALANLGRPGGEGAPARIYLEIGSFTGGSKAASADVLDVLRNAIRQKLGGLQGVTFELTTADKKAFAKSGRVGFLIDGNVSALDESLVGGTVEVNCDLKVMVAKWPSKSIILWTSAGAAVQGGSRERDKEIARRDCLEASAGQVGDDLKRFFESQGG